MGRIKGGEELREAFCIVFHKQIKFAIDTAAVAGGKPIRLQAVRQVVDHAIVELGYSDKCNVGDVWIWIKNTYKRLDATKKLPRTNAKKSSQKD